MLIITGILILISSLIIAVNGDNNRWMGELLQFLVNLHFVVIFAFYGILIAQYYYPIKRTVLSCIVYTLLLLSSYLIFWFFLSDGNFLVRGTAFLPPNYAYLIPFWGTMTAVCLLSIVFRELFFADSWTGNNSWLLKERKMSLFLFSLIILSPILIFSAIYFPSIFTLRLLAIAW